MSNIISFGQDADLTTEEIQTRDEELKIITPIAERLSKSKSDSLKVAACLTRIRNKHSENSPLYKSALEFAKDNFAGWDDKNYRQRLALAYKGYQHLAGSDTDKEWILKKLNPSYSALAACDNIPDHAVHEFTTKVLKGVSKFPTAEAVINFAYEGKLTGSTPKPKPKLTTNSSDDHKVDTEVSNEKSLTTQQQDYLEEKKSQQRHAENYDRNLVTAFSDSEASPFHSGPTVDVSANSAVTVFPSVSNDDEDEVEERPFGKTRFEIISEMIDTMKLFVNLPPNKTSDEKYVDPAVRTLESMCQQFLGTATFRR